MRTRGAVALLGVLLTVSACTGGSPSAPPSSAPPSGAAPAATPQPPTLTPIKFSDQPLWTRQIDKSAPKVGGFAMERIDAFDLVGDAVVYVGYDAVGRNAGRLVVADAATGTARWSLLRTDRLSDGTRIGFFAGMPDVIDRGGDWSILITYERDVRVGGRRQVEEGVAALSGKDGRVRWRIPVHTTAPPTPPGQRWTSSTFATLWTADSRTALARVVTHTPDATIAQRTVALDLAARRTRWQAPGTDPEAIAGGVVIAERPRLPYKDIATRDATLVALDAATGAKRWDLAGRHPKSRHRHATEQAVVVGTDQGTVVLDPVSGRELASLDRQVEQCRDDGPAAIACTTARVDGFSHIVLIRRTGETATITEVPQTRSLVVRAFWRGRIVAAVTQRSDTMIDDAGRTLAEELPGQLRAINENLAVFVTGEERRDLRFSVYRVVG